jgi:NADH-quinone oxidoreductase subunit L
MSGEQDMRRMGGLWNKIPITYVLMWIGSLSLAGIPFFSGYYSKDSILDPRGGLGVGECGRALLVLPRRVHRLSHRLLFMAAADHDLPRHLARRSRDTAPHP